AERSLGSRKIMIRGGSEPKEAVIDSSLHLREIVIIGTRGNSNCPITTGAGTCGRGIRGCLCSTFMIKHRSKNWLRNTTLLKSDECLRRQVESCGAGLVDLRDDDRFAKFGLQKCI